MNVLTIREPIEAIHIDTNRLGHHLKRSVEQDVSDHVFHLADTMAQALGEAETNFLNNRFDRLVSTVQKIATLAEMCGFISVRTVAGDVTHAVQRNDAVAVSATVLRLLRIGEKSLYAIWDLPEQFV
jgi:hypothetical protein